MCSSIPHASSVTNKYCTANERSKIVSSFSKLIFETFQTLFIISLSRRSIINPVEFRHTDMAGLWEIHCRVCLCPHWFSQNATLLCSVVYQEQFFSIILHPRFPYRFFHLWYNLWHFFNILIVSFVSSLTFFFEHFKELEPLITFGPVFVHPSFFSQPNILHMRKDDALFLQSLAHN